MKVSLNKALQDLLSNLQNAAKHPYVSDITKCIKLMLECFDNEKISNKKKLDNLTLSLSRLVSDDYEFSKSEVGIKINKVINQISETT